MKLQKHFAYKYKDKKHFKNVIVVPDDTVEKLGWETGLELEKKTQGDTLIIRPIAKNLTAEKIKKNVNQ